MSPRIRTPSGPEFSRRSETVSVAVVSPTSAVVKSEVRPIESELRPIESELTPKEEPVVEVVKDQQEKAVELENIFERMNQELVTPAKEPVSYAPPNDIVDIPPPPSVANDDVFLDDDPLPPPPPEVELAECSKDNFPLPSPPEEVLGVPRVERQNDHDGNLSNEKHVDGTKHLLARVEAENAKNLATEGHIGSKETDIDFASPPPEADNEREERSASPPPPLVITSTPTRDLSPEADSCASPVNSGSTLSTPGGSRPNSMLSPKLEALDKEKVRTPRQYNKGFDPFVLGQTLRDISLHVQVCFSCAQLDMNAFLPELPLVTGPLYFCRCRRFSRIWR